MSFINTASAHEVYVLDVGEVEQAISAPSPNPFTAITGQGWLFLGYGFGIVVLVAIIFSLSVSRLFERVFDPFLRRLKRYAPFIARLTIGSSLFASGAYGALFGPELPLSNLLSPAASSVGSMLLMIAGMMMVLGLLTRVAALIALSFYVLAIFEDKIYMLTYANYLGEITLFLILGAGIWSVDRRVKSLSRMDRAFDGLKHKLEPYAFLILRILFGGAVFFASFYAKFLHSNLAIQTVAQYHLTDYFPFSPLFLVLGAFLVEAVIGIAIAVGFELRFFAIVFTFFLALSISFFGEAVWPHVILFGVNLVIFFHGYDRYTLTHWLFERKRKGEPVF